MVVLEKAASLNDLGPGQWCLEQDGKVMVRCGHADHVDKRPRIGCIHTGTSEQRNWKIAPDGTVTPSVFFNEPNCGWHEFVRLAGWDERSSSAKEAA